MRRVAEVVLWGVFGLLTESGVSGACEVEGELKGNWM